MTEFETQLLTIIEEQQEQLSKQQTALKEQQQALEMMQNKVMRTLFSQSRVIENDQNSLQQVQLSLATIQQQFHELEKNTASYTKQINGRVQEMSQITANNEDVLEKISNLQHSVSAQYEKAQQNLLETSEVLKRISAR